MENKFTSEQIEKAKIAGSPEELLSLAKESGLELSEEQANAYFDKLNKSGELSDDELNNVAGGGLCSDPKPSNVVDEEHVCDNWRCKECGIDRDTIPAGLAHYHQGILPFHPTCSYCKYCYQDGPYYCCGYHQ